MYRQGDVLIERAKLKEGLINTEDRLLVRGEGRNHAHYIFGSEVDIFVAPEREVSSGGGIITHFLNIKTEARLEHRFVDSMASTGEHGTITIPPGTYRVIRQREYNPYEKAIRAVKD